MRGVSSGSLPRLLGDTALSPKLPMRFWPKYGLTLVTPGDITIPCAVGGDDTERRLGVRAWGVAADAMAADGPACEAPTVGTDWSSATIIVSYCSQGGDENNMKLDGRALF